MGFDNPTKQASQELGNILDQQHHDQDEASRRLREVAIGGAVVAAGAAAVYFHAPIGETIAKLAGEESSWLGRTGLRMAGTDSAALKLGEFFTEQGNLEKAESVLLKSATKADATPMAQMNFASFLLDHKNDEQSALKFLGYASDRGYAPAIREMGKVNELGVDFISQDRDMAEAMYRTAADMGDGPAKLHLDRFLRGEPLAESDHRISGV